MKSYEITYLTTVEETADASSIASLLSEHNATITSVHPWGTRRRLVYPIKKQDQAFYTTVVFEADPVQIAPLQRSIYLSDAILRSLIVEFEPGMFHRHIPTAEELSMSKTGESEKATPAPETSLPVALEPQRETVETSTTAPAATSSEDKEIKPKRTRTRKTAASVQEDKKSLDEKLDQLLNEDITK